MAAPLDTGILGWTYIRNRFQEGRTATPALYWHALIIEIHGRPIPPTCAKIRAVPMNDRRSKLLLLSLGLSLLVPLRTAVAGARGPADAVSELYAAIGSDNGARALALLSDSAGAGLRHEIEDDFRFNCVAVRALHVTSSEVKGETARLEAIAHVVRTPRGRGTSFEDTERRRFDLRLQDGVWRIEAMPLAEDLLIDRIVENPQAARALLSGSPELFGPRLVERLVRRAITIGGAEDYPRPVRYLSDLAFEIASSADDHARMALALAAQLEDEQRVPGTADKRPLQPKALWAMQLAEEAGSYDTIAYAAVCLATYYLQEDASSRDAERVFRHALQYRDHLGGGRISQLLTGLGICLYTREDYAAAYQVFTDCLAVAEREHLEPSIAFNEVHLGRILERQSDFQLAADHFRRSTQFKGRKPYLIMAHLGIARADFMLGRRDLAEKEARRAMEIAQATPFKGLISRCSVLIAELQIANGDMAEAEKTLKRAIAYGREVRYPVAVMEASLVLGNVYYRLHRYAEAVQVAKDAEDLYDGKGFPDADRYATLMLAARCEIARGNEERAIAHLADAIEVVEAIRGSVAGSDRQQLLFFEPYRAAYAEMVRLLAARGAAEEALRYAERGKGRVLLDSLGRTPGEADELLTAADRKTRDRLIRSLQEANRRVIALHAKESVNRSQLDQERTVQRSAQVALDRFDSELEARHPRLVSMRGKSAPVTAEELRDVVANRRLVILEYVVHEQSTTLFVIRGGAPRTVEIRTIDISREELQAHVETYAGQLESQSLRYKKESQALYNLLIAPVAGRLIGARALCIVPDGVLWKLPFESLIGPDNRFLVERTAFFYAPSISAYRAIVMRQHGARVEKTHRPLVAFGNPAIGETRGRLAAVYRSADLGPLPEAEVEARTIAAVWGRGSSAYTGADAREDVAKREMARARIVHFAAHGLFDDANPMYSQVVLAPYAAGREDGALQAWEMMRIDLAADLVVLSACETARGRVGAGEGLIGMSWALFIGGCPSTVAARWKIESTGSTRLMVRFHRALSRGARQSSFPKAEALREAQLQLLRAKTTSHPFYWASFTLIGSPQ